MWVYDGDQWINEGGDEQSAKVELPQTRVEEFLPELQVLEIVPIPKVNPVPPFPLP